jgi:hypothetical protein
VVRINVFPIHTNFKDCFHIAPTNCCASYKGIEKDNKFVQNIVNKNHDNISTVLWTIIREESVFRSIRGMNAMVAGAGPVQSMYFCELKKSIGPNLPQAVWGYFVLCNILKHGGIFHRILHRIFYGIKLVLLISLQKSGGPIWYHEI